MTTSTVRTGVVRIASIGLAAGIVVIATATTAAAQDAAVAGGSTGGRQAVVVACSSTPGERRHCPADTSAGVLLTRESGEMACLLGRSWGYDAAGVWVVDGCSGEFLVAGAAVVPPTPPEEAPPVTAAAEAPPAPVEASPATETVEVAQAAPFGDAGTPAAVEPGTKRPAKRIESWGEFEPGVGFLLGRSKAGELSLSAYGLVRYINQLPEEQSFTDHLGNEHPVDTRHDLFPHRIMVFLKGWLGTPKLIYNFFFWTVTTTEQDALFGVLGYQFSRKFSLYAGINGLPGTRSVQGSHPYWLGHDRVMADEFFRPYFAYGIWAQGETVRGTWYNVMVANNNSALGVKASQLDREVSYGGSFWWMPTTHEFGPRGAFGDWEMHEEVATRFGVSAVYSPEERYTDSTTGATGNTTLKLADSLNVFDTGALAPGVTVQNVDYQLLAIDAGLKYRGLFLQTELYRRQLDSFVADGALPVTEIVDTGFYVQAGFYPIPRKLEIYAATSQIFGDDDAGFGDSSEYLIGANWYPFDTRNHRLNLQIIDVNDSPAGSTFGYYTAGQDGTTVSAAFSVFF
jgi:hypothetical protein